MYKMKTNKTTQTLPTINPANLPQADATMLCDFLHCQRYYYWRHERQIESVDVKVPLAYGIAIHAMLAEWYKTADYRSAMVAFDTAWKKHGEPEGDAKRNPLRAAEIMNTYRQFYPKEPFKVIDAEVRGALPAGNFMLIVIIDLVIEYPGYGILPMDHKTTSYLNEKWWSGMNPKHQYSGYLWAMRQLFGKNCNSLFVNGILIDKTRCLFERRPTTRNDWELSTWLEQMNHVMAEIKLCQETNTWPQNDDFCQRWPESCSYHSLCTTPGIDYRKLEPPTSQFKKSIWDPLNEIR